MTQYIKPWNYAFGTLASPLSNVATSVQITVAPGASFPSLAATVAHPQQYYYLTIASVADEVNPGAGTHEVVKVTGPSSGGTGTITLTIVRAQEGTSAQAF